VVDVADIVAAPAPCYLGPPLDVWSLGVILFAILCGRLPFEGPDLVGTKRPREQIIKSRITKCQYKVDDNLGLEAKDLIRRMLQVDPSERASVPEIFNHAWVRPAASGNLSDAYHMQSLAATTVGANHTNRAIAEASNLFAASTTPVRQAKDDLFASPVERLELLHGSSQKVSLSVTVVL
jgi:serine/threonine protein kinase